MQIKDILDDLPTTPDEQAELILGLLERIEHWNAGIRRHQSEPQPDQATIEEFTEQRNKYVGQLALVLHQYGLVVLPGVLPMPFPPSTGERLAA